MKVETELLQIVGSCYMFFSPFWSFNFLANWHYLCVSYTMVWLQVTVFYYCLLQFIRNGKVERWAEEMWMRMIEFKDAILSLIFEVMFLPLYGIKRLLSFS